MLGPSSQLRQVKEGVLQELHPDRIERPLEWRRHFNIINFVISNPRVQVSYQTNDLPLYFSSHQPATSAPLVTTGSGARLSIQGSVEHLDRLDNFFQTKRTSADDESLFDSFPAQGSIQVEITSNEPFEGNEIFGPGTYPGTLWAWDPKIERDSLSLDLRMPLSDLREIAAAIETGKAPAIALQVGVHVFTYEVDDALREPHHRQTFIVQGHSAAAALLRLKTLPNEPAADPEDDPVLESVTASEPNTPKPPAAPPIASLSTPLWTIVGLLVFLILTR